VAKRAGYAVFISRSIGDTRIYTHIEPKGFDLGKNCDAVNHHIFGTDLKLMGKGATNFFNGLTSEILDETQSESTDIVTVFLGDQLVSCS
jgi:hypothetical protein